MSIPKQPDPAKLVISLFMNDKAVFTSVLPELEAGFGPVDLVSPWLAFDYTDYYFREMGSPLFRRIVAFKNLIRQSALADIKHTTNALEAAFLRDGRRNLNIDPGYLLLSRFILATGKDFSHRIYLKDGIYADLTLVFRQGAYHGFEWTYPDYAGEQIHDFLLRVRENYALDLKRRKTAKELK